MRVRYLGGKSRCAKKIVDAMRADVEAAGSWWEPFCGGLSVTRELSKICPLGLASDACGPLIALYQAVADGWSPPDSLSEAEWREWREAPEDDPRLAFARFGCTFGGNWSSGYARAQNRNFAAESRRNLRDLRTSSASPDAVCSPTASGSLSLPRHLDFLAVEPDPGYRGVIYCDPPYAGTTSYGATPPFDHETFYRRVREWSAITRVYVSEYAMPWGRVALEFNLQMGPDVKKAARVERLYKYGPDRILDRFGI